MAKSNIIKPVTPVIKPEADEVHPPHHFGLAPHAHYTQPTPRSHTRVVWYEAPTSC